jgi:putative endonuclease
VSSARADRAGRQGETLAALWLMLHGWRIVARRQRIGAGRGVGEVDLIARRGRVLAFVEVKWRAHRAAFADAIDEHRLARVARAAEALIPRYARAGDTMRIDVILLAPWQWPRHIVHVWQP